jgi:hypothetical protein
MRGQKKKAIAFIVVIIVCILLLTTCSDTLLRTEINILAGIKYVWKDPIRITATTDQAANAQFGFSVSISTDYTIVGALGENGGDGAAYIFKRNGDNWSKLIRIGSPQAGAAFGSAVSISGDYAIIGAYNANNAYVYYKNNDNWTLDGTINGPAGSLFGASVSINGLYAVVGANAYNSSRGAAYLCYKNQTPAWGSIKTLFDSAGIAGDQLGSSVSISENYVVVGSPRGNSVKGLAIIYQKQSEYIWSQLPNLIATGGTANDNFGQSVSITDNLAVIGASGIQNIYVFNRSGSSWSESSKLYATPLSQSGDYFGWAACIYNNYIITGAHGKDSNRGAVYGFDNLSGYWNPSVNNPINKPDPRNTSDHFGRQVSISSTFAIISADGDSDFGVNAGSAYIFKLGYY